jgi:hypothetical protein
MKVTCKTLQGAAFQVECEPAEKVASLKQKIQAANPSLLAEHAVTVFQGKVLQDGASLEEAGVSEKGFVVVMVKKPAAGAWALPLRRCADAAPAALRARCAARATDGGAGRPRASAQRTPRPAGAAAPRSRAHKPLPGSCGASARSRPRAARHLPQRRRRRLLRPRPRRCPLRLRPPPRRQPPPRPPRALRPPRPRTPTRRRRPTWWPAARWRRR